MLVPDPWTVGRVSGTTLSGVPTKKPAVNRGQNVETLGLLRMEQGAGSESGSLGCGGEVGIGLHSVLADVETFDFFLFGDTDAAEEGTDD
jgi:hypothetical protein